MTTIFEIVQTALNTLSPPVPCKLEPYLGPLPDLFIVYLLVSSTPVQHADNEETERSYLMQVTIRNKAGLVTLPDVDGVMKVAGFSKGPERQLPKDPKTGHFAMAKDYIILLNQ